MPQPAPSPVQNLALRSSLTANRILLGLFNRVSAWVKDESRGQAGGERLMGPQKGNIVDGDQFSPLAAASWS